ncbi:MAG: LacI family DNA-binding transcriptional regulator [Limnochordia bacterium]
MMQSCYSSSQPVVFLPTRRPPAYARGYLPPVEYLDKLSKLNDKVGLYGMAKITLRMIAERAGVSVGTVSMVLNEKGNISEETRRNVKDIAQQLGYRRRRPGKRRRRHYR